MMNKKMQWLAPAVAFLMCLILTMSVLADTGTVYLPLVQGPGLLTAATATATAAATATATAYSQSGGNVTKSNQTYAATQTDQSGVYVTQAGIFTLSDSTVTTSGNTSSGDNSSFYGLNAAVLANSASTVHLTHCTVTSSGSGANGVFATGSGSSATLENVVIKATGALAHGVMATNGGALTLTHVDMTTTGPNSGAIATDRGGGTIIVTGGTVTTTGADAPGIYSTGRIQISAGNITAIGSEAAVIEGSNSIELTDTNLLGSQKRGVMLYQSMSGDADGVDGVFSMSGGSLAAAAGPLFYVTNATGHITLTGVSASAASGTVLNAAAGNWGSSGSNGGRAHLNAEGQALVGNILVDNISTAAITLQNSSSLTGAINSANTGGTVNLTLDASSTWNVTATSYLTCLADPAGISGSTITNIQGNGYTVYYDSSACSALGGGTYTLSGGGSLQPVH